MRAMPPFGRTCAIPLYTTGVFLYVSGSGNPEIEGRQSMARKCDICGKGTVSGNKVSHAKNRTRRVWKPNLLKIQTMLGKTKTTIKICTRCLRTGKVVKVV